MADLDSKLPKTSGIYQIRNTVDGKIYVGSSTSLKRRWRDHKADLSRGCHHNVRLQRAWDKHGPNSFVFEILEITERSDLIRVEQDYIDRLHPFELAGYNIALKSTVPMLGRKHSPEAIAKMSVARMGYKPSPEAVAKMTATKQTSEHRAIAAACFKGRKHSAKAKARNSAAHKGKQLSSDHKANIVRAREQWTLEEREKHAEFHKSRMQDPEVRARIAAAAHLQRSNPESLAKLLAAQRLAMKDPAVRARLSKSARKYHASRRESERGPMFPSFEEKTS